MYDLCLLLRSIRHLWIFLHFEFAEENHIFLISTLHYVMCNCRLLIIDVGRLFLCIIPNDSSHCLPLTDREILFT